MAEWLEHPHHIHIGNKWLIKEQFVMAEWLEHLYNIHSVNKW